MGYVGSYYWQLRQKVGRKTLLTATADVIPVRPDGKIKLVLDRRSGFWTDVGGHVEPGDSWGSAAIHELEEEAGIVADEADLELVATISGPGLIMHYPDGDTQPFTNIYLIKKWSDEHAPSDDDEVAETRWVSLDEAKELDIDDYTARVLAGYEKYLETGKVQAIEKEKE
jgi:8-oxo-dGTP pyrophosphatase MutT (NUDIX family)